MFGSATTWYNCFHDSGDSTCLAASNRPLGAPMMMLPTSGTMFSTMVASGSPPWRGVSCIGGVPDAAAWTAMAASRSVIGAAPDVYAFSMSCWAIGMYSDELRPSCRYSAMRFDHAL